MRSINRAFATEGYPSVASRSTLRYTAKLVNEVGQPLSGTSLDTFVLSIVDTRTGSILNAVDGANVLNTGRGSVDESGMVEILLTPDDTDIGLVSRGIYALILDWTYGSGKRGRHQVNFKIETLPG